MSTCVHSYLSSLSLSLEFSLSLLSSRAIRLVCVLLQLYLLSLSSTLPPAPVHALNSRTLMRAHMHTLLKPLTHSLYLSIYRTLCDNVSVCTYVCLLSSHLALCSPALCGNSVPRMTWRRSVNAKNARRRKLHCVRQPPPHLPPNPKRYCFTSALAHSHTHTHTHTRMYILSFSLFLSFVSPVLYSCL
jgi:hypothetical protein